MTPAVAATNNTCDDAVVGNTEVLYPLHDTLGSVIGLVRAGDGELVEKVSYDPYGQTYFERPEPDPNDPNLTIWTRTDSTGLNPWPTSAYGNPFLWTGQRHNAGVGLYHFMYRSYSPRLGRWIQRDPLRYIDGVSMYEYVAGRALSAIDPIGLWKQCPDGTWVAEPNDTIWGLYKLNGWLNRWDEGRALERLDGSTSNPHLIHPGNRFRAPKGWGGNPDPPKVEEPESGGNGPKDGPGIPETEQGTTAPEGWSPENKPPKTEIENGGGDGPNGGGGFEDVLDDAKKTFQRGAEGIATAFAGPSIQTWGTATYATMIFGMAGATVGEAACLVTGTGWLHSTDKYRTGDMYRAVWEAHSKINDEFLKFP